MGFDWASLIIAGLSGGIAGALGGMLGSLFGGRGRSTLTVIFIVAGVVFLPRYIEPVLNPYIGPLMRDVTGQTDQAEREMENLTANPLLAAVIGDDPEKEADVRARLTEAYRVGGIRGIRSEIENIGREYGQDAVFAKLPRAQAADVLAYFNAVTDGVRHMVWSSPDICYQWLYGAQYGDPVDGEALITALGEERVKVLFGAMVAVINNAGADPVVYNRESALQRIQAAAGRAFSRVDQGSFAVMAGERAPQSREEMIVACQATGDLYTHILQGDAPADTIRELFAPIEAVLSHVGLGGIAAVRQVYGPGDPGSVVAGQE